MCKKERDWNGTQNDNKVKDSEENYDVTKDYIHTKKGERYLCTSDSAAIKFQDCCRLAKS